MRRGRKGKRVDDAIQDTTRVGEIEREREGEGWKLLHQPQPGWLAVRGNCRAMFIATQFVKPTLNGNNVPLSASFLSLSQLPCPFLFLSLCCGNRSFHVRGGRAPYMCPASAAASKFGRLGTLGGGCLSRRSALCSREKLKRANWVKERVYARHVLYMRFI